MDQFTSQMVQVIPGSLTLNRWQLTSHYLKQCWGRCLTPYGINRPQWVNPSHAEFILENVKIYWHFLLLLKDEMVQVLEIILHSRQGSIHIFNTVTAAGLVTQRARTSAAMVLTGLSWNILVSAPVGLNIDKTHKRHPPPPPNLYTTGCLLW